MILDFANKWKTKDTLRVKFLNGDDEIKRKLQSIANKWTEYANISFQFVPDTDDAEIRIKFGEHTTDSKIGTDCLTENPADPTMRYMANNAEGLEAKRVLHEFGHALGLIHEQFHPIVKIDWNREAAIDYYKKNFNYTENDCEKNLFRKYIRNQCQFFKFDRDTIMLYPIPKSLTLDGSEFNENEDLSIGDKQYIKLIYPQNEIEPKEIKIDDKLKGNLSIVGQEDIYRFTVDPVADKRYYIQVTGETDVLLSLFRYETEGPRKGYVDYIKPIIDTSSEKDSIGKNAKLELEEFAISQKLPTTEYYIRVRHSEASGLGNYEISLNAI